MLNISCALSFFKSYLELRVCRFQLTLGQSSDLRKIVQWLLRGGPRRFSREIPKEILPGACANPDPIIPGWKIWSRLWQICNCASQKRVINQNKTGGNVLSRLMTQMFPKKPQSIAKLFTFLYTPKAKYLNCNPGPNVIPQNGNNSLRHKKVK